MDLSDLMEFSTAAARLAYPQIVHHMEKEAPIEAVGWLWDDGTITRFVNQARATDRFAIGQTQMAEALAANDPEERLLIGLYHSHPNGTPHPSDTDTEQMRLQFVSGINFPWLIVTPDHSLIAWFYTEDEEVVGLQIHKNAPAVLV